MRSPVKSGSRNGRDAEAELNLPPGFRFHPTDEELVVHYLCSKAAVSLHHKVSGGRAAPPPIIAEVDLYKHDPWDLPGPKTNRIKSSNLTSFGANFEALCSELEMALFGEKEWYFFTPRDRKYPNGLRPNRAAGSGYWKATGADKPIRPKATPGETVGIKKALVFYAGKAPKGIKTNWIMHEYRLARPKIKRQQNDLKGSAAATSRLDDWVLCRLYNKKNNTEEKIILEDQDHHHSSPSEDNHRDTDHSHNSFNSLEESDAEITYNPTLDEVDLDYNHQDASDENELEFMMKSFGAEIDYLDMMSQNDTNNDSSAKAEGEDGNGNDWFTSLSWEDMQQSLEAMPTVAPLPGDDQFSCGHKMPILDRTNQLPFLF